tara:strand:- start:1699 stop:1812 length:114 start_codon:yes stop_codon:yes gene_type:complete
MAFIFWIAPFDTSLDVLFFHLLKVGNKMSILEGKAAI